MKDLKKEETIGQSLEKFFEQELLTQENKYDCGDCGAKVTAKKGYILKKSMKYFVTARP